MGQTNSTNYSKVQIQFSYIFPISAWYLIWYLSWAKNNFGGTKPRLHWYWQWKYKQLSTSVKDMIENRFIKICASRWPRQAINLALARQVLAEMDKGELNLKALNEKPMQQLRKLRCALIVLMQKLRWNLLRISNLTDTDFVKRTVDFKGTTVLRSCVLDRFFFFFFDKNNFIRIRGSFSLKI